MRGGKELSYLRLIVKYFSHYFSIIFEIVLRCLIYQGFFGMIFSLPW